MFKLKQLNKFQVIILSGLPGSGKSTWAKKIVKKFNTKYLSSDQIRLKYFKIGRHRGKHIPKIEKLGPDRYGMMADFAIDYLKDGNQVVLDATFLDKNRDLVLNKLLEIVSIDQICFVVANLSVSQIEERIKLEPAEVYQNWKDLMEHWQPRFESGAIGFPRKEMYPEIEIFNIEDELNF